MTENTLKTENEKQTYSRAVLPPPAELATAGKCNMGTFSGPVARLNPLEIRRPLGFPAPRIFNSYRLKEWEAFQVTNEDYFLCLAVYNAKSIGIAIVMLYDRQADKMYRYEHKAPFWKLKVPRGLDNTQSYYRSKNFKIEIENKIGEGYFKVNLEMKKFRGLPDCQGAFTAYHETDPIVIAQPFGENRPLYSHKALMPVEGELTLDGKTSPFGRNNGAMIIDDHKGFYPYVMQYDWVTGLGNANGKLSGFNLTDNQIQDPHKYNENCLWLEGKMIPLPPIQIKRPEGVGKTWEIFDEYERVNLRFTPLKDVPVYVNLLIAETRYHGPTGRFEGYILDDKNKKISFDGFIGMGEQKYIRM